MLWALASIVLNLPCRVPASIRIELRKNQQKPFNTLINDNVANQQTWKLNNKVTTLAHLPLFSII